MLRLCLLLLPLLVVGAVVLVFVANVHDGCNSAVILVLLNNHYNKNKSNNTIITQSIKILATQQALR
jgi:hypothetical protein